MIRSSERELVGTREYDRFVEFCNACQRDRYIGVCYGPPGVGKTVSARSYANWNKIEHVVNGDSEDGTNLAEVVGSKVVFYTAGVVNSPGKLDFEISRLRTRLRDFVSTSIDREEHPKLTSALDRMDHRLKPMLKKTPRGRKSYFKAAKDYEEVRSQLSLRLRMVQDPTALVIIDEADRLKMAALDQVRDIFDRGGIGLVLIGMPNLYKQLARYPQLYSRVGFVHEFRPLAAAELRRLLLERWSPPGIRLPGEGIEDKDAIASILQITGGNFRLLNRLLTQAARIAEINQLPRITTQVLETARESLVIGNA